MDRRNFLLHSTTALGACMIAPDVFAKKMKTDPMSRIGMTSVIFRNRFPSTAGKPVANELKLIDIPEYYTDRFKVHNIEVWTKHFESSEESYLKDLKKSISKSKCKLINIQCDSAGFDVSEPDDVKRESGIEEMKKWINIAAFLDSQMVRVTIMKKSLDHARTSIKLLTDYANKKGLMLMVENHNDLFSDTNNHIQIAKEMEGKNFGLIADFGNYRAPIDRFEALKTICPYTKLISAKVMTFDKDYHHTAYDFDQCVRVMEENGYRGIYSIEQHASGGEEYDYERITDWAIEHIKANLFSKG